MTTPRMPHNAVMLGVDPGQRAGWAVMYMGELVVHGCVRDTRKDAVAMRDRAVKYALDVAEGASIGQGAPVPVMVAIEKFGHGMGARGVFGSRTLAGIERNVGSWVDAAIRAGIPRGRIVRVFPQTWRYAVLGRGNGSHEQMAALATSYVITRFDLADAPSEDECAAIGIACWMLRAKEVEAAMPKRRKP